jgi:acyl carrier protein
MKTHTEYIKEVTTIVADQLCLDEGQIVVDSPLRQQGSDSLDDIEMIMAIENDFGVEVPDEVAESLTTVNAIVAFLEKTLGVAE